MVTLPRHLAPAVLLAFSRRWRRRLRALVPLAFACGACNGHAINDRNAEWCVETGGPADLLAPAVVAADEWRRASDGEVDFSFVRSPHCPETPRIVFGETAGALNDAHVTRDGELVISTKYPKSAHCSVFLHEFGHYLTGYDHSADPADVMFASNPQDDACRLTDADAARLDRPSFEITEGW